MMQWWKSDGKLELCCLNVEPPKTELKKKSLFFKYWLLHFRCIIIIGKGIIRFQGVFTNSFRFSRISKGPNNTKLHFVIRSALLLLIHIPSGSPQLHFKSTAPKCVTVECPGYNILTQCQYGRYGCKVSAKIYNGALEIFWQLSFYQNRYKSSMTSTEKQNQCW